jgi:hypothetical protein
VGWWAAIWGCGDTAGNSVENKGILEDSRRRGHNGGTFQKGGQFKGLPLILTCEQSHQTPPTGRRFSNHGSNEKTFISLMAWARRTERIRDGFQKTTGRPGWVRHWRCFVCFSFIYKFVVMFTRRPGTSTGREPNPRDGEAKVRRPRDKGRIVSQISSGLVPSLLLDVIGMVLVAMRCRW